MSVLRKIVIVYAFDFDLHLCELKMKFKSVLIFEKRLKFQNQFKTKDNINF